MQHGTRRPHGIGEITSEFGPVRQQDTLQCPHCSGHFVVEPGSGTRRGWCFNCAAVTCGAEACVACVPWEKALEAHERREAHKALRGY